MTLKLTPKGSEPRRGLGAIAGPSASGKTFSALLIASGIRDGLQADKGIAMIDTELRGNIYEDRFEFDRYVMDPPFAPEEWLSAFRDLDARYSVIISDSYSDLHEGTGGLCDIADKSTLKNPAARWADPKARNKQLMGAVRRLKSQHLFLLRASDKIEILQDKDEHGNPVGKQVVKQLGWQPHAEKNFKYDISFGWMLPPDSRGCGNVWKDFDGLEFSNGEQLSEQHGRAIAAWIKGQPAAKEAQVPFVVKIYGLDGLMHYGGSDWSEALRSYGTVKQGAGAEGLEDIRRLNKDALVQLHRIAPPDTRARLQLEVDGL
jgi:hypothetical protein